MSKVWIRTDFKNLLPWYIVFLDDPIELAGERTVIELRSIVSFMKVRLLAIRVLLACKHYGVKLTNQKAEINGYVEDFEL